MVKDEEFEGHLRNRKVQRIPKSMIAFGEALYFQHIFEDLWYLCYLILGAVYLFFDELSLYALKRIGDQFSEDNWDVDGYEFMDEGEGAEIEIDHKHSYKISLNTIIQLVNSLLRFHHQNRSSQ